MDCSTLKDYKFISNINSTSLKTTAKYAIKSQPNTYKNTIIVKTIILPDQNIKQDLIRQQFAKLNFIKAINLIKNISVEPSKNCSSLMTT